MKGKRSSSTGGASNGCGSAFDFGLEMEVVGENKRRRGSKRQC